MQPLQSCSEFTVGLIMKLGHTEFLNFGSPSFFTLAWRGQCLGKTAFDFAVFATNIAEISWSSACVICSPLLLEGVDMESEKKPWVHSDFSCLCFSL